MTKGASEEPIDVSVIIPAYKRLEYLGRAVESVLAQRFSGRLELIVVISGDEEPEVPPLADDPRVHLVTHVPRLWGAAARNKGIEVAKGLDLAFTDADAIASPDWLEALRRRSTGGRCVAGAVINGTPHSACGTAEYLTEFLDLYPGRRVDTAWHGALCNLYIPAELRADELPFDESMRTGEDTLLTASLAKRGRLVFAPDAAVTHLNRTTFDAIVHHHVELGRGAANLGRRSPDYKWRILVRFSPLAPLAAAGRVISVYARVLSWLQGERLRALRLSPLVVTLLAAWGWGLLVQGIRLDLALLRARFQRLMTGARS